MVRFAQLVIGPPGSGKSTYCWAAKAFLEEFGRKVSVVNLDPANDDLKYKCDADISELVTLVDVMDKLKLGPNGSLVYCMEFLDKNISWLQSKLDSSDNDYFLLDCPGQVELFTHHQSVKNISLKLQEWKIKLVCVHLVDSHLCSDPGKFISAILTSLSTMVQLELPHINILSKVDLVHKYGKLAFNLDYYSEVQDLSYLLDHLSDNPFLKKYKSLNESLISVVEDYSLVSLVPLNVQDKESMFTVMKAIDKAVGYAFYCEDGRDTLNAMMSSAAGADFDFSRHVAAAKAALGDDITDEDSADATVN